MQKEPDYKALENSLIDIIKEEQIKLGYKSETIRLYYPMDSIQHLLGITGTAEELKEVLNQFCRQVIGTLGGVTYTNRDNRFCMIIPPEGVTYVHEKVAENHFLKDFIQKIGEHACALEDILEVFHRYSDHVLCEPMTNGEFDYKIMFEDGKPDHYRYCIKFEGCHAIYHRFTKADYEEFGF